MTEGRSVEEKTRYWRQYHEDWALRTRLKSEGNKVRQSERFFQAPQNRTCKIDFFFFVDKASGSEKFSSQNKQNTKAFNEKGPAP